MTDEKQTPEGPRKLSRGTYGPPIPDRGSIAPQYRGRGGGTLKPPNLTVRRTSTMPIVPLAERPECQPHTSAFRQHPSAPKSQAPNYTRGGQQAAVGLALPPEPAAADDAPPPAEPQGPVLPAPAPIEQPVRNAPQYAKRQGNTPNYVTGRQGTTPNYVTPPARPTQPAPESGAPQGQESIKGTLQVQINHKNPQAAAHASQPAAPMSRPLSVDELRQAADQGDEQAAALLSQLGDDETQQE